jgi:hypothetical protein
MSAISSITPVLFNTERVLPASLVALTSFAQGNGHGLGVGFGLPILGPGMGIRLARVQLSDVVTHNLFTRAFM